MNGYYSQKELRELGLKSFGENVLISKKASIYMPELISIGHDVRIDDFCFLVGNISLGSYIHLPPFVSIHGTGGGSVVMKDFSGLGSYSVVYAASDDYGGDSLVNSLAGSKYEKLIVSNIVIEKHAVAGAHCVLLPNSYLAEGTALGARTVLSTVTEPWSLYLGYPCRKIANRKKECIKIEEQVYKDYYTNLRK